MEKPYSIIKTILVNVEYDAPDYIRSFFNDEDILFNNSYIDVIVRKDVLPMSYFVDVYTNVTEGKEGNQIQLKITYSVLVKINDCNIQEDEILNILKAGVPKDIFNSIRDMVLFLTKATGLPPVRLKDYESVSKHLKDYNIIQNKYDVEPPLGYEWIIYKILTVEDGAGATFLDTFSLAFGTSWKKYRDSLFYRYYYRFMKPIKYVHPDFEECEADFWDIFFQLVMGESDDVIIEKGKADLPEIIISFEGFVNQRISNMSLEDIKDLTFELATIAFTNTMVSLCAIKYNDMYGDTLSNNYPPLKAEILKLYNYDNRITSEDYISLIDRICEHLRRYDDLTFEYRLLQ